MIYFTSDLHFCHDKWFLYVARGFKSIDDMNEAIIERWNSTVTPDDDVYVLGDLMLNDNEKGTECIRKLNGKIHIVLGNHDSDARILIYKSLPNVVSVSWAERLKYEGITMFMTHYPCMTRNSTKEPLKTAVFSLFGHTHSRELFYNGDPYAYNVSMDAHDCRPVSVEQVRKDIIEKYQSI